MATKKTTGKKLADMMYGNPEGAAFGITPFIGKRREDRQDRQAAKSFPVDLARGVVAGAAGLPGDIESLARLPYELIAGNESPTILPTSEDVLKRIPFGTTTPAGQFASGLGTLAGGSANLGAIPRAVKAAPGALKAAARNLSTPSTLNPQAGVFIGPKAKTFNQGKADMAVAMEEARRTPEEIWLATGTFRGADGILRQEIDDRAAKLVLPDEQKDRVAALKGRVGEMKESIKPIPQKDLFPKALTEAKKGVRSNIDALKEEISGRSMNPRTQGLDAQYAFDHPELYKAYPELRDLNIVMGGREGTAQGASGALSVQQKTDSYPGRMEMDMYNRGLMSKNPTSVALHEMQHAIQTLEGMGPGGSPTFAFANPEAHEILKKLREETYKPSTFEQFQRVNKFPEDEAQAAYEQYLKERKANPITSDKVERAMQETAAMEYYKRLAGEAEARAVQDRQMMTPAQRMETPPPASYDVPQEDLIVKPPREYAEGGSVHFSDNPDVMQLELAKGGLVKGIKAAAKAIKGTQDVLPAAEREENLQKFLGNSRIRERLYHATPKDFKAFKPGGDDPKMSGPAIWLTPDAKKQPAAHNISSRSQEFREGVNVMPVYAQARSPLMLDDKLSIEWARDVFADGSREFPDLISQKTIDELKGSGYDSIIHADPYGNRGGEQEILMFEPNKIKSAIGNRGTYDIEDPDITKAEGGAIRMQAGGLAKAAKAAAKALKPAEAPMKASEALGRIEGRPLVITQADRTKVGGGYLGGPGFSGLQLEDPAYRAAEAAWAVKNPGTAKMILGGRGDSKDAVYAAMLGTPTQHQSNQMVFDKLLGDFKKAAKKGGLEPELRDRINMRLANSVDKDGNNIFPPDVDILDKNFKDLASTFDRRSVTANLIGGMGVGGKKGQIIDYDKIIRQTTDPMLLESPTGALGNRLFTLSGGVIERPDLHPAFPTIMQGEDLGVSFSPVARDLIMKDFTEKTMREKGRTPGYMDYTRGYPPSQLITEDILTEMQKLGLKKGGAVRKAAGGEITADDLILEERKL